jgi:site-specific DNA recombinase
MSKRKPDKHTYSSPYLLTGIIRCRNCGLPFQGLSGTVRGGPYPRYIDGGWKAKRGCSSTSIRKERLESFVLDSITRVLQESASAGRIEDRLTTLLAAELKTSIEGLERLKRLRSQLNQRIQNLLRLAEDGAVESPSLRSRLAELERERISVEMRIKRGEQNCPSGNMGEIALHTCGDAKSSLIEGNPFPFSHTHCSSSTVR